MNAWTFIHLEAYCSYAWMSKKKWTTYEIVDWEKFKTKKSYTFKNKEYIPKSERPNWCVKQNVKRIPQAKCLLGYGKSTKRCPFFACANADKKDYIIFDKAWEAENG